MADHLLLRLTRSRVGGGGLRRLAEKLPLSLKSLWLDVGSGALAQTIHKT